MSRALKGAIVSIAATAISYWLWTSARAWAAHARDADPDAFFGGFAEALLATCVGAASMPILIWAGIRTLGERDTLMLVAAITVSWVFIGAHVVEDQVGLAGTIALLALHAALGTAFAALTTTRR